MIEHSILFSTTMVRALLDGSKTQMRRIVKSQPPAGAEFATLSNVGHPWHDMYGHNGQAAHRVKCPYGQPGERLWVREHWCASSAHDPLPPRNIPVGDSVEFLADGPTRILTGKARRAFHMPRWASRILLEITDVRVERLQDISEEDAKAEGARFTDFGKNRFGRQHSGWRCDRLPTGPDDALESARWAYANLWESINGRGAWGANPFVWVIEFKRIEQ